MNMSWLKNYFEVDARGSTLGIEARAGVVTFLTMSYILFVNPQILSQAIVVDNATQQLLTATALAAGFGSILMGVLARYPFALAPGMGLNAYFAYSVVLGRGIPWPTALGAVFISGVLFIIISATGVRSTIVNAIPMNIKLATGAGIGLFLAIIGLHSAGLVVADPATLVTLGNLAAPQPLLAILGLLLTSVLLVLRVRGAILLGILVSALLAIVFKLPVFNGREFGGFAHGVVAAPVWPSDVFMKFDLQGAMSLGVVGIAFMFLFVDFFDTAGTLFGLAGRGGFLQKDGTIPRSTQVFMTDAIASCMSAVLGTSTTTAYIESASGIEEGGKTGITAVVVGCLFLVSIFFWPVAGMVPTAAVAPALIIVGAFMMSHVAKIDWDDFRESLPAFLTIIGMPLTFSIANGVSFGIISFVFLHLFTGRGRQVHWLMYALAVILVARYAY